MNKYTSIMPFYRFRSFYSNVGNIAAFQRYSQVQPNNNTIQWQQSARNVRCNVRWWILNAFNIQHIHTKAKNYFRIMLSILFDRGLLFPESGTFSSLSLCKHCNSIYCNQRTIDYHQICDNHMIAAVSATIDKRQTKKKKKNIQSKCIPIKMHSHQCLFSQIEKCSWKAKCKTRNQNKYEIGMHCVQFTDFGIHTKALKIINEKHIMKFSYQTLYAQKKGWDALA